MEINSDLCLTRKSCRNTQCVKNIQTVSFSTTLCHNVFKVLLKYLEYRNVRRLNKLDTLEFIEVRFKYFQMVFNRHEDRHVSSIAISSLKNKVSITLFCCSLQKETDGKDHRDK